MRHVHTVRLSAPKDSLIQRGSILLEDALHVASLPEPEGERVLIVRSLNIGAIRSHQSSASLALTVQQRLSEISLNAVYAIDPAASRASVIYFRNDAEPYWVLAARLAKGLPATEWFWQLAIPHWKPNFSSAEGLRQLAYQIGQTQAGVSATVAFVQHLIEQDAIAPLLTALSWQDGDRLLQLAGFSRSNATATLVDSANSFSKVLLGSSHNLLLRHAVLNWGIDDPRSIWLGAMILIHNNASRLVDSRLVDRVVAMLQTIDHEVQSFKLSDRTAQTRSSQHHPEQPGLNIQHNRPTENTSNTTSKLIQITHSSLNTPSTNLSFPSSSQQSSSQQSPSPDPASITSDPSFTPQPSPTWTDAPQFTPYAGLIFLIPLLDRLQIATFLENNPEYIDFDLPRQIVKRMSDRLKIPPTDPTQSLFANLCNSVSIGELNSFTRFWITNLRRWSRRNAKIGLYNLICRPGRLLISKTHIDVFFHHEQADIRLRRVGLDINPGWLPWWGQVISFHYVQEE